jgi:predicted RNA-binding protein with PUA-like domain
MAFWLVKSEPDTWSWDQHVKTGNDAWTGVRNFQARTHLNAMKKGDKVFFYHTGEEKAVVGVSEVAKEAYPDPTDKDDSFVAVDLKAVEPFKTPVTLAAVKADKAFKDMVLVKAARLSVQPVTADEWKAIRKMGGLK